MKHLMVILSIGLLVLLSPLAVSAQCYGDFDCDGTVDGADLARFAETFGRTGCAVWIGEINGMVQCPNGDPLAGATVYVAGDSFLSISDDDGRYKIRAVPEGSYTLVVRFQGQDMDKEEDVTVMGEEATVVDFTLNVCSEEICDGIDNDQDGAVDEDLTGPDCPMQAGVCAGVREICGGTNGWLPCDTNTYSAYSADYEGSESSCDGLDNDCDGLIDENLSQTCGQSGIGQCQPGTQSCVGGQWGACEGEVLPSEEVCDGLDNDCDGETDEGAQCDDGVACTLDSCNSGECIFTFDDEFCNDGLACTTDSCGVGGCTNAIAAGTCAIDGACYSNNDPNPTNDCLLCASGIDQYSWTAKQDGSSCSSGTCLNSVCQ